MIDGKKMEIIPNSEFVIDMKPPGIDDLDTYLTPEKKDTIAWHSKNYGVTSEDIIKKWQESVDQKTAWDLFLTYFDKYNPKKKLWTAPMMAGMNIKEFDLVIIKRLMETYKTKDFYWKRDKLDLMDLCFLWFESLDEPKAYNMEALRTFFGMSKKGSHDAMIDVNDTTELIIRFMKLTRGYAKRVKFKGACRE